MSGLFTNKKNILLYLILDTIVVYKFIKLDMKLESTLAIQLQLFL